MIAAIIALMPAFSSLAARVRAVASSMPFMATSTTPPMAMTPTTRSAKASSSLREIFRFFTRRPFQAALPGRRLSQKQAGVSVQSITDR
ncbi:MAG: hypothetical protein WDN49_14110 [Acetobacteraceae bacterium]